MKDRKVLEKIIIGNSDIEGMDMSKIVGRDDCLMCGHPLNISKRIDDMLDQILDVFQLKENQCD